MSERAVALRTQGSLRPGAGGGLHLQRRCACGTHTPGGGECAQCRQANLRMQRKLALGPAHDALEREADAVAHRVLAKPVSGADPTLRQDMEPRFGVDLSTLQVYSGAVADASTRRSRAQAHAVGLVQRQPEPDPPSTRPAAKKEGEAKATQPPPKSLKSEGVALDDPVAGGTATVIDEVLARNGKLAPYIGDRLKAGFKIAEKGRFVRDSSDGNFDAAYRKAYELAKSEQVPKDTKGFFDAGTSQIHLRPDAVFGTALHESIHRLAAPVLYSNYLVAANRYVSSDAAEVLKEGVTAYFTDLVLKDEGLPNFNDAYRNKKRKAENLITALGSNGFDLVATFNFKGGAIVEMGEKLGYTKKQFDESNGKGLREVLKRMGKAM